jgi:hypothetical protein
MDDGRSMRAVKGSLGHSPGEKCSESEKHRWIRAGGRPFSWPLMEELSRTLYFFQF